MSALDIALLVVLVACFGGAAALAVVEVSILRVRRTQVSVDADEGDRRSVVLLELLDDLPVVLNTVLLLVLLCQVGVATISAFLVQRWSGGLFVTIASVAVSLLLFVYAEAIPKTLAVRQPYRRARSSARALRLVVRICRPAIAALVALADLQSPSGGPVNDPVSERELRMLARQSALEGSIGIADAELVDRSFAFGDQTVADVMVERQSIKAVREHDAVARALELSIDAGHRRLPVFDQGLDDMTGVVRLRDLAAAARSTPDAEVGGVMTSPLFCSAEEWIADLLQRMRTAGTWIAIVQSADGTTVGLVTVEDVVAELMGDIEEEPVVRPDRRPLRDGPDEDADETP